MPPEDSIAYLKTDVAMTTCVKESEDKHEFQPQQKLTSLQLFLARFVYISLLVCCYWKADVIQTAIGSSWLYLKKRWWFETVYFETLLVIVFSFPSTFIFHVLDMIPALDKYRVAKNGGKFVVEPNIVHLYHSIEYFLPLGVLDTFHVKHYHDVSDDVIAVKRESWIQRTRALPIDAPLFGDMVRHILIAIIIYDALFFTLHYSLHKNQTLYRIFHKTHHTHEFINAKATDHEHWVERVAFILCANAGLKIQGAHPFTRMVFVFVFVSLLLYNHGGYDFPWMPDRVLPGGILCGARQHYKHHAKGERNYQFIFTYLDNGLDWLSARRRKQKKT